MAHSAFNFSGEDALNYETYLGPLLFEPSSVEFLSRIPVLKHGSVLELAAGTGRLTRYLRKYFPSAVKIMATDIRADMLEQAGKNWKNPSIEFQIADMQQLSFPDNSFDLVLCQYGFMFLPDKQKGFNEAFRVLKPGGRLIFSTWESTQHVPLLRLVFEEHIIPFFNEADSSRFRTPFSLYDPELLSDFLQRAGFQDIQIVPIAFKSGPSTPENIVNAFLVKHSMARTVAEKDPGAVERMAKEMKADIETRFGEGEIVVDLKAWIGSGEK